MQILLNGALGRMGKAVTEAVANDDKFSIVAGIDAKDGSSAYPLFKSLNDCNLSAQVIVDFSSPKALPSVLAYAMEHAIPAVLCTTGLTEDDEKKIEQACEHVALLRSANMSIGVNVLHFLLRQASPILSQMGFDIELIEKHHNQKLDAPSGTALALVETIKTVCPNKYSNNVGRTGLNAKRDNSEIGIHAVRGGGIIGTHSVLFAGTHETLTLTHEAASRELFVAGALQAAQFIIQKKPGLYTMDDCLGALLNFK